MSKLPILKEKVDEAEGTRDTFNDFHVKALNQHTAAYFILKALICLLIALMTLYLYVMLRLSTMPKNEYNCTATTQILDTLQSAISNVVL
jgi:hypothetical protein